MDFMVQGIGVLRDAARLVYINLTEALRISLPWTLCGLVPSALLIHLFMQVQFSQQEQLSSLEQGELTFGLIAIVFLSFMALPSIAVNWHRLLLLNERPRGRQLLRLDGLVWSYLGNGMLISIIICLLAFIPLWKLHALIGGNIEGTFVEVSTVPGDGGATIAASTPFTYGATILADVLVGTLFFCLALKLPAVAVGHRDFSIGDSWRHSEGHLALNGFLAAAISLATLLADAAVGAVGMVAMTFADIGMAGTVFAFAMWAVEAFVLGFFGLTVLTALYRQKTDPRTT